MTTGSQRAKILRLLGLARRAGALVPGTEAVRASVRDGDAKLVVLAGDASEVQLDKIRRTMSDRPIPQATLGDRDTLGAAVGLGSLAAVAVTDESLAGRIISEIRAATDSSDVVEA